MEESEFHTIVRHLVAMMNVQFETNQKHDAHLARLDDAIGEIKTATSEIKTAIQGINVTMAGIERLLARSLHGSENGRDT